jgi:hypothetical protein
VEPTGVTGVVLWLHPPELDVEPHEWLEQEHEKQEKKEKKQQNI